MSRDSLPDPELHDLLHLLAENRREQDRIFTRIYEHIELKSIHEQVVKAMLKGKGDETVDV